MKSALEVPFKHIAIEGVPKSQKTRLAQILPALIGGRVVLDRTENPYLRDFYDEKEGASFLAQLVFLVNRYHQQLRLSQRDLFEERIICDYLFEKDKIFAPLFARPCDATRRHGAAGPQEESIPSFRPLSPQPRGLAVGGAGFRLPLAPISPQPGRSAVVVAAGW